MGTAARVQVAGVKLCVTWLISLSDTYLRSVELPKTAHRNEISDSISVYLCVSVSRAWRLQCQGLWV